MVNAGVAQQIRPNLRCGRQNNAIRHVDIPVDERVNDSWDDLRARATYRAQVQSYAICPNFIPAYPRWIRKNRACE